MARGNIQKRQGSHGPAYRVRVEYPTDPVTGDRRQRSATFRTKREAETALATWLAEVERGTAVDTTTMTVADFLHHWLDSVVRHRVRATTFEGYRRTVENHIIPALGSVPVQRLTPAHVQAFYAARLDAGLGPRSVQLCHLRLSQALAQGLKWGTVSRNVCDAVEAPKARSKQGRTWTPDEARRFLVAAGDDTYSPLWLLALTTGARQGELLGLRWQDVDSERSTITIRQSLAMLKGRPVLQEPKSRAAKRTIGLPVEAVAALKSHKARQNAARLAAGAVSADHDLVFASALGTPLQPSNIARNFRRLIDAAGVPSITFHEMRHTHATWLIAGGQPITNVSARLGHAKSSITLDVYAHVVAATRDQAALAVSALLFADDEATGAGVGS